MGLTNQQQAVLTAVAFVLISIEGFLQQQTFIQQNLALNIVIAAIPIALLVIKEFAGTTGPAGILTDSQQATLVFLAAFLLTIGASLSASTTNPLYLFILGVLAAAVMGLKEWLGVKPTT